MSEHKWYMMAGGSMSDTTERLAGLLAEHRPRPVGIRDLVECSCGDEATYTPDRAYATHAAAVLTEAGVGFVTSDFDAMREYAEAERERANEAERERDTWRSYRLCSEHMPGPDDENHGHNWCVICLANRAEKAEAALAQEKSTLAGLRRVHSETVQRYNDLRERVRAMADGDECELLGQYASRDLHREVCPACSWARRLRALLDDRSAS